MSTSKISSKILFQLSGSIACFKACALLSSLVKSGYEVEIVATASALKFIGEATLEGLTGRRVHTNTFEAGSYMSHIHLVRWADVIVLCPASANTLNKFAAGIADDLVSTLFLAHDFKKPYLVAPAMNQTMYTHPATQKSLRTLADWGVTVLDTGTGALACGENGEGRMLEPHDIQTAIEHALSPDISAMTEVEAIKATISQVLKNRAGNSGAPERHFEVSPQKSVTTELRRILITSGGTEEPIDGVRSITNTSTGQTGAELAEWFIENGAAVTLLHARTAATPATNRNLTLRAFSSFESLDQLLKVELGRTEFEAVIHLAAVADYSLDELTTNSATIKAPVKGKIDSGETLILKLKKNPKLVDSLRAYSVNPDIKVVAFKLTRTNSLGERLHAVDALASHAMPDFIVHNDLTEMEDGSHPFTIYDGKRAGLGGENSKSENRNPISTIVGATLLAKALASLLDSQGAQL
jgi:phosphopantothenoylcysteine decarboxylase/phosphopantothenate--cysteine ligase